MRGVDGIKIVFKNGSALETIPSETELIRGSRAKIRLLYDIKLTRWQRIMLLFYCAKIDLQEKIKKMLWRKI